MAIDPKNVPVETSAATAWASSATGREAIENAIQRAQQTSNLLDEGRKVDFDAIRRPLGMRI